MTQKSVLPFAALSLKLYLHTIKAFQHYRERICITVGDTVSNVEDIQNCGEIPSGTVEDVFNTVLGYHKHLSFYLHITVDMPLQYCTPSEVMLVFLSTNGILPQY